jgi:hypothetical protein
VRTRLAIVLLSISAAVPAQQLGTLFHSAKERELLDRQRRGEKVEAGGQAVVETRTPVITGYVKRSDGKSTVFLDKRPYRTTSESVQRSLEPRIVERYEEPSPPLAAPESPARTSGNGKE